MQDNGPNSAKPRHTCGEIRLWPKQTVCEACYQNGRAASTLHVFEYLRRRAVALRSVQPTKESERIADALEAEARRIVRGDHVE